VKRNTTESNQSHILSRHYHRHRSGRNLIKVEDLTKVHRGIGGAKPLTGQKREREVIKRRNDVTSTKEKVDRETLPDGTVREGVERETTVDKSTVETEREKELEVQVEHYRDMVSHLELSIQRKDKGSMLNSNTYNSECGAYIVLRTLALAKKALRELVDEEVLEQWMDSAGASPADTPCYDEKMQDALDEMGRANWKNHINADLLCAGWTRQDLARMVFPH
jgi:hypothetical protein